MALAAGCLASACLAAYEWRHRHRLGHGDGGGGGRRRGMMSLLLAARDAIVGVRSAPWHEDDDADLPEVRRAGSDPQALASGRRARSATTLLQKLSQKMLVLSM